MKFPQNYLPVEAQEWVRKMEEAVSQVEKSTVTIGKNMIIQQAVTSAQEESSGRIAEIVDTLIEENLDTMEVVEEIKQTAEEAIREAQVSNEEARDALDSVMHVSDRSEVWIGDTPPVGEFAGENIARAPQGQTNEGIQPQPLPGGSFTYNYNPSLQVPNTPANVSRALLMQKNGINQDDVVALGRGLAVFTPGIDDYYAGFYITTKLNLSGPDADLFFEEYGYSIPYELRVYIEIDSGDPDVGTWQEDILPPTQLNMTQPRPYDEEIPEQDLGVQSWHWVSLDRPVPQGSQVYVEMRFLGDLSSFDITGSTALTMISGITARHDRRVNPLDFFDGSFDSNSLYDYHWSGNMGRSASYRTLAVQNDRVLWINTTGGANVPMTWNPVTNQWEETQDAGIAQAAQDAADAAQAAQAALDAATSKNEIIHAITAPIGDGEAVGDMWMRHAPDIDGPVDGWWTWTGTNWVPMELRNEVIANLDAGKITSGTIDANRIGANSITAGKINVGNFNNLFPNPEFEVDEGYNPYMSWEPINGGLERMGVGSSTGDYIADFDVDVEPGENYSLSVVARASGGALGTGQWALLPGQRRTADTGTWVRFAALDVEFNGIIQNGRRNTRNFEIPANTDKIRFGYYVGASAGTNVTVRFERPILNQRMTGELIVDGAVIASKIATDAVEADKIAANAVRTQHLEANSVVASKLSISDFTNYIADAELTGESFGTASSGSVFAEFDWTSRIGGAAPFSFINSATYDRLLRVDLSGTNELRLFNAYTFEVQQDDEFLISWDGARHVGGGSPVYIGVWTVANNRTTFTGYNSVPISSSSFSSGEHTVRISGASAKFGALVFRANVGRTPSSYMEIGGLQLRRKSGGSLIVDGAIIADKLAANAVTAEKVAANAIYTNALQANAVTTDKLQANAITAKHTITGATVQTLATANRGIKLTGNELSAYNSSGTRKVLVSGSTGEITVNDGTFTGSTFRTAASGARTEMTSGGVSVFNSANQVQVQLGHGVDTGLAIRQGSNMVPLAPYAFGSVINTGSSWTQGHGTTGTSMGTANTAGWSTNRTVVSNRYQVIVQLAANVTVRAGANPSVSPYARVNIVLRRADNDEIITSTTYALDYTASFKSYLGDIYASSNYWNTFYGITTISAPLGTVFRAQRTVRTVAGYNFAFTGLQLILRPV